MALDFGFVLLLPLVVLSDVTKYDQLTILVIEINVNALQQVESILLAGSAHCDIPALLLLFLAVTILNLLAVSVPEIDSFRRALPIDLPQSAEEFLVANIAVTVDVVEFHKCLNFHLLGEESRK